MQASHSGITTILIALSMSVAMSGYSMFDSPAVEESPFAVVAEQDSIQVRDYKAHAVAETEVDETCHATAEIAWIIYPVSMQAHRKSR